MKKKIENIDSNIAAKVKRLERQKAANEKSIENLLDAITQSN